MPSSETAFVIAPLQSTSEQAYDELLASQPDALFYASRPFRRLLETFTGARSHYIAAHDQAGDLTAALPAFVSDQTGHPPVMNSLPFYGSNGGIVGRFDADSAAALLHNFEAEARRRGCAAATFISSPFDQPEQIAWYETHARADLRDQRIGQVTFLPAEEGGLTPFIESDCHLMVRRAIRKARQNGVSVTRADRDGLAFVAQVHQANMQAIGGRAKPQRFFDLVGAVLEAGRDYRVFVAYVDGKPAAALLNMYFNQTVEYFTPVISAEFRSTQALSLVIFEAMQDAIASGFRRWNWGGTWASQDGVYAFKSRWGARDMPYHYFVRVFDRAILKCTPAELLERYPYFYVVPFSALEVRS